MCMEVVVTVVVMGAYCNKYIILLCYSYYFIVLKTKTTDVGCFVK